MTITPDDKDWTWVLDRLQTMLDERWRGRHAPCRPRPRVTKPEAIAVGIRTLLPRFRG